MDILKFFGAEIGTLIYGAGKGIIRSFQDFDLCAEPYMKHPKNTIYYFGDMDYEGIGIYEIWQKISQQMENYSFCAGISGYAWKAEQIIDFRRQRSIRTEISVHNFSPVLMK